MTGASSRRIPLAELIGSVVRSAAHLELRDAYTPDDPLFAAWRSGTPAGDLAARMGEWSDLVRAATGRGVRFRRLRVVSEPVTDYIRYEYDLTGPLNIAAGEQVRWLPRRRAFDLLLPSTDLWLLDERTVRLGYFSGGGNLVGHEVRDDPAFVAQCASAFGAAWERAVDHDRYQPV